MHTRNLLPTLLLSASALSTAGAQQYVNLGPGTWANDISPDGEWVVGSHPDGGFIWRWRVDPAPTVIPGGNVVAVSDDGQVVAGTIIDPGVNADVAAIWTEANGWQGLGWLPQALSCPSRSTGYDISGDGTTVVGLSWDGCSGRGFRWTQATGMQELQNLANGGNRATTISGDGSVIAGFAQGSFSRTPAYWAPDLSGFVLDQTFQGEVYGTNENGTVSVGTLFFSGLYYSAFKRDALGNLTNLGSLNQDWAGNATDLSEDETVIVGYDNVGLAREAWVWTEADGIISLDDRLAALGITGTPETLVCRACSDDGNIVVGGAGDGFFDSSGFIVEFSPSSSPWTDLGQGLAGTVGTPELVGIGTTFPNAPTTLTVSGGLQNAFTAIILGLSQINAPFQSGTLVPSPDIVVPGFTLDGNGELVLPFNYPALPSGFSLFWQAWIADPGGLSGWSATNGLSSTTP